MTRYLSVLLLTSLVGYTAINPLGGDSPFKWVLYAFMILLPLSVCLNVHSFTYYRQNMSKWFWLFSILFPLQIIFSGEKIINDFILWCAFLCLSCTAMYSSMKHLIFFTMIILLAVDICLGLVLPGRNSLAYSYSFGWTGMFQNPNTHSAFLCSVLIAILLGCSNKKIIKLLIVSILIGILATRSRNGVLTFIIIVGGLFFEKILYKYQKWFPLGLLVVLVFAGYYMLVVEPLSQEKGVEMFGKGNGSAGRSLQIIYMINNFDINLWGHGRVANSLVEENTGYPVHNMYIASIYVLGVLLSCSYLYFILWVYRTTNSYKLKLSIIGSHFYYFFEPGYFFCVQMSYFLPMFIICANYWNTSKFNKPRKARLIESN